MSLNLRPVVVGTAIGAFERNLMTPGAFDAYLDGDESALTELEQEGLLLFIQTGCTTCHYGAAVGGERYAVMGDAKPYPGLTDEVDADYIAVPEFPESGPDTPAPYSYEGTSSN